MTANFLVEILLYSSVFLTIFFIIGAIFLLKELIIENKKKLKVSDRPWRPVGAIYDENDNLLFTMKMEDRFIVKTYEEDDFKYEQ